MGKIDDFGFMCGAVDPGTIYRHLRRLEDEGFVSSKWDTTGTDTPRWFYEITPEGEILLKNWIVFMEKKKESLNLHSIKRGFRKNSKGSKSVSPT